MDQDGIQTCLEQLGWMVNGVTIQHNQLERFGKLKNTLNFVLNIRHGWSGARTGRIDECRGTGTVEQVVLLGQGDVAADPGDEDARLETPFDVVEQGLLHHVCHFIAFQGWADDDDWPHGWHDIVWRYLFSL